MTKVFLYGAFRDNTRSSCVCQDINFGDLTIYQTMKRFLTKESFVVDYILPNEIEKLSVLDTNDWLVIGGGGVIHPDLLNTPAIIKCAAKKAVFGIGINWEHGTRYKTIKELRDSSSFLKNIPFVCVRDYKTREFLGVNHALVYPDVILSNWIGETSAGVEKAVVITDTLFSRDSEDSICFYSFHARDGAKNIGSISQLIRFGYIRSRNYHGMLLAFVVNATAEIYDHNVKHDAFLRSYADKLDIRYTDETTIVRCKNPKWFYDEANKSLELLLRFLKQ
jgi:hypothetical protein